MGGEDSEAEFGAVFEAVVELGWSVRQGLLCAVYWEGGDTGRNLVGRKGPGRWGGENSASVLPGGERGGTDFLAGCSFLFGETGVFDAFAGINVGHGQSLGVRVDLVSIGSGLLALR